MISVLLSACIVARKEKGMSCRHKKFNSDRPLYLQENTCYFGTFAKSDTSNSGDPPTTNFLFVYTFIAPNVTNYLMAIIILTTTTENGSSQ
jgi:hypothetical protein